MNSSNTNEFSEQLLSERKLLKLQKKLSLMNTDAIKEYFKESLNSSLLYGIPKYHKIALTIYMLSDDSLKEELDNISIEVQNKKIDINETIMNSFAMGNLSIGLMAQVDKEDLEKNPEKKANSSSVIGWFSRGWNTYRRNKKQLIIGAAIFSGYSLVLTLLSLEYQLYRALITGCTIFITPVFGVGWLFYCLTIVRGENANLQILFSSFSKFWRVWVTTFFHILIVMGGCFLFVVPGIIWGLKYGQSWFAIMDRQLTAREALRFSGRITKGVKVKLFIMYLAGGLLGLIMAVFGIGLQLYESNSTLILLIVGIVLYLFGILVIQPWIGATYATAYDNLASGEEDRIAIDRFQEERIDKQHDEMTDQKIEIEEEQKKEDFKEKAKRAKELKKEMQKAENVTKKAKKKTKGKKLW